MKDLMNVTNERKHALVITLKMGLMVLSFETVFGSCGKGNDIMV